MTAYSMSHRWVGVVTGGGPPPFPTLMHLAMQRDLSAEPAALEQARRQALQVKSTTTAAEHRVPISIWAAVLADALGPEGCAELARLKAANNQAVRDTNAAYIQRRRAMRALKASGGEEERREAKSALQDSWAAYRDAQGRTRVLTRETAELVGQAIARVRRMQSEAVPGVGS